MEGQLKCPVCDSGGPFNPVEDTPEDTILKCNNCSLEFARSMQSRPAYYEDSYYNATPALEKLEKLSYDDYLKAGKRLFRDTNWQPYNTGIKWIAEHLKPGETVLDIGCGAGWLMAALESGGFKVFGLEVSQRIVDMLKIKGFRVLRGPLERCQAGFCNPGAITMFEVLEHLQQPMGILKEIHTRFPASPLIISVPTPRSWTVNLGIRSYCDYPPNHLTRWAEKSLKLALNSTGYKSVQFIYPRIPVKEIYGGIIIWIIFKLGLRKKGYFGEIKKAGEAKNKRDFLNNAVRIFYPLLNLLNKLAEALFLPFAAIIAMILNKKGFTSFCVVAIAQE